MTCALDLDELQRLFDLGRFLQVADYCKDRLWQRLGTKSTSQKDFNPTLD